MKTNLMISKNSTNSVKQIYFVIGDGIFNNYLHVGVISKIIFGPLYNTHFIYEVIEMTNLHRDDLRRLSQSEYEEFIDKLEKSPNKVEFDNFLLKLKISRI